MRAYVVTSGLLFLALPVAHVARLVAEGWGPLHEPVFVISTLLALGMAVWAAVSFRSAEP
jgi:hypothetical protein